MTAHLDEPRRVAAARLGEPQALEWVFQTYHRSVYALCFRLLSRADDAEDAAQATFVRAFRGLGSFRGGSTLKTWLYRIAVNESLNLLRQRRRAPERLPEAWPAADRAGEIVQRRDVAAVLQRLRPDQRLVLILFYWEDLSCEEIAAVMEVSHSAAKMRLKRAREEFRRQYGGEP
jgi:RNA polymerase sigma-70 factor (ECF subfamily)